MKAQGGIGAQGGGPKGHSQRIGFDTIMTSGAERVVSLLIGRRSGIFLVSVSNELILEISAY